MSEPPLLPPIAKEPLSVLLLARDEIEHLPEVIDDWAARLDSLNRDYELIVVDDGSTDGTAGMASFLAERRRHIRVLAHPEQRGLGAALRTGLAAAQYPLLFYTTCDRQYQPADLTRFIAGIDQVHFIAGYRKFASTPWPLRWLGWIYRGFLRVLCGDSPGPLPGWLGWSGHFRYFLARVLLGVRLHDVDGAFRLFRRSIFDRIPIQCDGPFAQVEILAKANFLGCIMADEPVGHRPEADRSVKMHETWRETLKEIYRLLANPDFGPAFLPERKLPATDQTTPVSDP